LSYAFPSESYVRDFLEDKNVKLIKREGTQIIDDEGEVIGGLIM
jgi:predicted TPR repeat methyltransferase